MFIIDTDVLSIHHIFTNDKRYISNEEFFFVIKKTESYTTIFNLLELCGILATAGYRKQADELYRTYLTSEEIKLLPPIVAGAEPRRLWQKISEEILEIIKRGIRFGDASILWICEKYPVEYFITWNVKHYNGKTRIKCLTPRQFLERFKAIKNINR